MDVDEAFRLIDAIDDTLARKVLAASISPEVFMTLDDINAGRREIEGIESKINEAIRLRLKAIAGSVYVGHAAARPCGQLLRCGQLSRHAPDEGADHRPDQPACRAHGPGGRDDLRPLLCHSGHGRDPGRPDGVPGRRHQEGRAVRLLPGDRAGSSWSSTTGSLPAKPDSSTTSSSRPTTPICADKIVSRYCLPEYVRTALLARNLIVEEDTLSLAGIVHLAHDTVQASFQKNNNRLVLKCQVPRPGTDVTRTLEAIVTEKFKAVGPGELPARHPDPQGSRTSRFSRQPIPRMLSITFCFEKWPLVMQYILSSRPRRRRRISRGDNPFCRSSRALSRSSSMPRIFSFRAFRAVFHDPLEPAVDRPDIEGESRIPARPSARQAAKGREFPEKDGKRRHRNRDRRERDG
ncbi:MAG: hypothetical protein MZU97_07730 [Bacillus subtilis]|nr:hypothetical protein [Bacillus subtilis]